LIWYVLKNPGLMGTSWRVKYGDMSTDFSTQTAAKAWAVDQANDAGDQGRDAQVLVMGEDGKWVTEYTYGHDPRKYKG
jgi:uncharacterized protein DUF2188